MLHNLKLVTVLATLLLFGNSGFAQTTVPLNTGYNHAVFNPYSLAVQDQYWINIASFPTTSPAIGPAWVIQKHPQWANPFAGTNWISARNTFASHAGTNPENPAYTIFRKCFCLLPGYKDAKLSFQLRGDDTTQVWLNTQMNQVLIPSGPNGSGQPWSASTTKGFRVGKNCVYVLLEDVWNGAMGFDLVGTVSAFGLLPLPAAGIGQSFEPCACRTGPAPGVAGIAESYSRMRVEDSDEQVVSALRKLAEARRAAKTKPIDRPNN